MLKRIQEKYQLCKICGDWGWSESHGCTPQYKVEFCGYEHEPVFNAARGPRLAAEQAVLDYDRETGKVSAQGGSVEVVVSPLQALDELGRIDGVIESLQEQVSAIESELVHLDYPCDESRQVNKMLELSQDLEEFKEIISNLQGDRLSVEESLEFRFRISGILRPYFEIQTVLDLENRDHGDD